MSDDPRNSIHEMLHTMVKVNLVWRFMTMNFFAGFPKMIDGKRSSNVGVSLLASCGNFSVFVATLLWIFALEAWPRLTFVAPNIEAFAFAIKIMFRNNACGCEA